VTEFRLLILRNDIAILSDLSDAFLPMVLTTFQKGATNIVMFVITQE
jgi:hypothetical protein